MDRVYCRVLGRMVNILFCETECEEIECEYLRDVDKEVIEEINDRAEHRKES